jgi:hypothetical protein
MADTDRLESSARRQGCWPGLPEYIRQAVLVLINTFKG